MNEEEEEGQERRTTRGGGGERSALGKLWDLDKLQMYIGWIKMTVQPKLTDESERVLVGFFRHHSECTESVCDNISVCLRVCV